MLVKLAGTICLCECEWRQDLHMVAGEDVNLPLNTPDAYTTSAVESSTSLGSMRGISTH